MTDNKLPQPSMVATIYNQLGANERAIIDKQKFRILRNFFILLVGLKLRLQFTGWLQYILPVPITLAVFLVAGIFYLLGILSIARLFAFAGGLLLLVILFDLITVKFQLHPQERLPKRNDNLNTFELMRLRRSCRSFQTRKLTPNDFDELMASVARHSAAAKIGKSPVRFEYISAPLTVWPTVNGSQFIVAIAPLEYDRLAVIDVGRSLQKIVIDATRIGVGTCWIGPGADHASIKQQLGGRFDPEKDHIICVCAVGYQSRFIPLFIRIFNAQFNQRLSLSSLFFSDPELEKPLDVNAEPFNRFGRNYEVCQWAPSSYNGQTTRCVAVLETNDRPEGKVTSLERFDFYAVTASRYYAAVAVGIWCANWEMGCAALGIPGHFAMLSEEERGVDGKLELPQVPRYDVSWVLEEYRRAYP